ncbi:MAG: hypothetical protein RLP15_07690 [Cryomorphaceae bacterium]
MKKLITLALLVTLGFHSSGQALIGTTTVTTTNPTNCTETWIAVNLLLYCANYTYVGATVTQSGSAITVQLDYTVGAICLPALQYPTVNVNLGQLPPGAVTVQAFAFLNSVQSSSGAVTNISVTQCCGAIAAFTPSQDTICQGDSITMVNTSTNADSLKWYQDGTFIDTAFSPTLTFDSAGAIEVMLVAHADTCNDTTTQIIQVYGTPEIDLGNDTALCTGDELSLSIPGNLNNILWSDGSTSNTNALNSVGTFWVQASSNQGCVGSDTVSITAILAITDVDLGEDLLICPGAATAIPSGGNYINHLWSTGDTSSSITVSTAGTYWLHANAAGECTGGDTIIVNTYSITPLAFIDNVDKCGENEVSTSVTYSSYAWSTGSTGASELFSDSATVGLTVTDANNCEQSGSFEVVVWDIPEVDLGEDTEFCPGEELVLESNIEGAFYEWSTGSTSSLIAVTSAGTYWLGVTSEEGCTGYDTVVVTVCVGLGQVQSPIITLFPNPASDILNLERSSSARATYQLYDAEVRLILTVESSDSRVEFDVRALRPGMHFIDAIDSSGERARFSFLKH